MRSIVTARMKGKNWVIWEKDKKDIIVMFVKNQLVNKLFFIFLLILFGLNPQNGIGATLFVTNSSDSGAGSFRDQVQMATSGDTIQFSIQGVIKVDSFIRLDKDLVIIGPGINVLSLDGQQQSRILQVEAFQKVKISNLHFQNGNSENLTSTGGAAIQAVGDLELSNCLFEGNIGEYGGGLHVFNRKPDTVRVSITNCSFVNNRATILDGGAINMSYADVGHIHGRITNCVFVDNFSASTGGAINLFGRQRGSIDLEINSCTITRNKAAFAGAINNFIKDTIKISNTIMVDNQARNGNGNIISGGYNLIDDTVGLSFQTQATDIFTQDAGLGPLISGGEWIPSVGLLCGSVAIDNGMPMGGSATDVRGILRDANPDIGAHERNDYWDKRIYSSEDGTAGSLRVVLQYACGGDTLMLDKLIGTVKLDTQIVIDKDITLIGNRGEIGTKFLNTGHQRFFVVENQTQANFHFFSFWGGNPAQNGGGAILNKGRTKIYNATFAYNRAVSGGALANYGDGDSAMMVLTNCTFSNNEATILDGGAIDNYGFSHPANLILNHCTLIKNSSHKKGGGIFNNPMASADVKNTILAMNNASEGPETFGGFTSFGNNLWLDTTFTRSVFAPTDLINIQPELDSFAYYGGPSYTYRPQSNSPVIDAGNNADAPMIDQRGENRLFGTSVDIGAYEYDPATSISTPALNSELLRVYPNPASQKIWIDFETNDSGNSFSFEIYTLDGKQVFKSQLFRSRDEGKVAIDISTYPRGLYLIIGTQGSRRYYQKVVFK